MAFQDPKMKLSIDSNDGKALSPRRMRIQKLLK